jgi:hypothetical protein
MSGLLEQQILNAPKLGVNMTEMGCESQRTQELQKVLLVRRPKCIELTDNRGGFPSVGPNRLHKIICSSVVKKKIRLPRPHNGAVRNSSSPAKPCVIPSARPEPIARSEPNWLELLKRPMYSCRNVLCCRDYRRLELQE